MNELIVKGDACHDRVITQCITVVLLGYVGSLTNMRVAFSILFLLPRENVVL